MIIDRKQAAAEFAARWIGKGDEKQDTQRFWIDLFQSVFGVDNPTKHLMFEKRVRLEESTRYIDVYIPDTKVLIEQKGMTIDLSKSELQSGGASLTPYNQARRYDNNLPIDEKARWIICCNFQRFEIHDMKNPLAEPDVILLSDFDRDFQKLSFIADVKIDYVRNEEQISIKAGQLVGKLYDAILPQYEDITDAESLKSLNQLCVRLVFCLYAEDTGLLGEKDAFFKYLSNFKTGQFRKGLIELFKVFDTPYEDRDKYMDPELAAFPYIKGGIFTDEIEIPQFTDEIIDLLLTKASLEVDWSEISPTVFGAVFESTLNPQTRHSGGMHYTSVENIHKVIDPLFLNDLKNELETILAISVKSRREKLLLDFQTKLSNLTFFDPACGSGNFLTETYLSLRRLENRVLEALGTEGVLWLGEEFSPIKVKIGQFYGIEINDFAVSVARTALWIAESQTMKETEHIVGRPIEYFPLKENPNIVEGNALRLEWKEIINKFTLDYIIGNPPFLGARIMNQEQKDDILSVFGAKYHGVGNLDYVTGWYKKASEIMRDTNIRTAFVSTNSITQGEQVSLLWEPLHKAGIHIDFAHRTFIWDSEASAKAHVHCVIIGFSFSTEVKTKYIYQNGERHIAKNINAYLIDSEDVFINNRSTPLCTTAPTARSGNKPIDGGHYLFTKEEKEDFISKEPGSEQFFRRWYGAEEFINNKERWCLWLGECKPEQLLALPYCMERVSAVRDFRLASKSAGTVALAARPTRFHVESMPDSDFLVMPLTSSERRKYVPIGYLTPDCLASNLVTIVPNCTKYEFGVLTSSIFMSWMRAVCGRLKSDYRITKDNVYNNFPWPTVSEATKQAISSTAERILTARKQYECSLADMYGEKMYIFSELSIAHTDNDNAVMEAYGFDSSMTEEQIVAKLFNLYKKLANQ